MTKGVLDRSVSDMLYWGEASMLFNKNLPAHQKKTINYLQMALNPIDSEESHFEKPMRGGIVTCDVEASLLAVSFPPPELDEHILISGLVQRTLFIPKTIDLDGRLSNVKEDIDKYGTKTIVNDRIDELVTMLKLIQVHYAQSTEFHIHPDALEYFEDAEKDIIEPFRNSNQRVKKHIGSFIASSVRKITAIAMHHCAMHFKNRTDDAEIIREDIEYAIQQVMKPQIAMIHEYLEERPEHKNFNDKEHIEILKIRKGYEALVKAATGKNISKKAFIEMIGKTLGFTSTRSIYKRYKMLMDKELIEEKSNDDVRFK